MLIGIGEMEYIISLLLYYFMLLIRIGEIGYILPDWIADPEVYYSLRIIMRRMRKLKRGQIDKVVMKPKADKITHNL